MIDPWVVDLSRWQFALTAMYHFLFVPLTLGLGFILAIMETVYVITGKVIYRDMTQFWGKLFAINFAMGIATGITLEFQFGTNWAYYAHYVGDIFGVPLAIEGLSAFFLESTLVGLFFFGWQRLSKMKHLMVTWLVAIGANLSALWILIANAWMQNPVGASFNFETMRMELDSLSAVFFNPVAQVKFVHTVAAGYVTGAMFVLSVSAYYLLKKRDVLFAHRSFAVAAGFGLASILSVIVLGDESGYEVGTVQKTKLAAIESEWHTAPPPAGFTIIGWPNEAEQRTDYAVKVPYVLGLIATRSVDKPVMGLNDIIARNEHYIRQGIVAYDLLMQLRSTPEPSESLRQQFEQYQFYLGYGLLLKKYTADIHQATEEDIKMAARHSVPKVWPLFFSFRVMVGLAFWMLLLFVGAVYYGVTRQLLTHRTFLRLVLWTLPAPWIASECGWLVAEYGRQPWAIAGILPTGLAASSISATQVLLSMGGLLGLYSILLVIEIKLMKKYILLGPSSLNTGRYHFEQPSKGERA